MEQGRGRRKRKQSVDWSGLPSSALFSILQRLTVFRDFFAFGGVCRAWRSISNPVLANLMASQPPLLCSAGGHHFYSFSQDRFHRSNLPGLRQKSSVVLGFSHGYLILGHSGPRRKIWLANPFTGKEITFLPPIPCSCSVEWAAMTAPPDLPHSLIMAWCRHTIIYCRPGNLSWSIYWCETEEERACSRCPVVLKGAVYGRSTLSGKLLKFEFLPGPRVSRLGAKDLLPGREIMAVLGGSADGFVVYRLDHGEWARVEDLGDRAIFITPTGSGEGNCIYYHLPLERGVKVFRMGGGSDSERLSVLPVGHCKSMGSMKARLMSFVTVGVFFGNPNLLLHPSVLLSGTGNR
ncbi:unnamed protein product [Spirodela intermedia]|uniref:KIB1-4 beta-propeller domain-containing protein n=1 Tax=Spirodela intermedia TaxID=51605 RepID=A0A7I8JHX1_SPIIN|nr:unnamed protein product [Spirodela intermedia]CAA6669757.1 unnamed protein product [Spirodela intermedia]